MVLLMAASIKDCESASVGAIHNPQSATVSLPFSRSILIENSSGPDVSQTLFLRTNSDFENRNQLCQTQPTDVLSHGNNGIRLFRSKHRPDVRFCGATTAMITSTVMCLVPAPLPPLLPRNRSNLRLSRVILRRQKVVELKSGMDGTDIHNIPSCISYYLSDKRMREY